MQTILLLEPVFKEMIWGATKLHDSFGFDLTSDKTGEAWVVSAHPEGDVRIANGELKGQYLSNVYKNNRALFGNGKNTKFPLMIKIIDANQDLSVQVHPNDEYAALHENSYGKTECWYVLDCPKDTKMVMGHHAETKDELREMIVKEDFDRLMNVITIKPKDFFFIPSGMIHAICSGTLVYEVQQNSNVTYRVYDYHRTDATGNPRALHLDKAMDVTTVPQGIAKVHLRHSQVGSLSVTRFVDCEYFSLFKIECPDAGKYSYDEAYIIVGCIDGSGTVNGIEVKKGTHFIVLNGQNTLTIEGKMTLMISIPNGKLL